MKPYRDVDEAALGRDWRVLCEKIGERRAGSVAERRAADFIATQLVAAGCAPAVLEEFPCTSLVRAVTRVCAREGSRWREVESAVLVGVPGTPGGRAVEGEMVWLEMPEHASRLMARSLRGKIAVIFGPLPTSVAQHRALLAAEPLAVVHIDERLPFAWAKSDGVYPRWARRFGMPPIITVPYTDAWRWRQAGVRRLRVQARVELRAARSQNVIAELPGRDRRLPAIVLTAHHDTQCGNPGADDNASGVVALLAFARALGGRTRRRTIRLISFGAEEQLSVGSAAYVRVHADALSEIGLVLNFDSIASPLGHLEMWRVGAPTLEQVALRTLARGGVRPAVKADVSPFFDHFSFNQAGVPSLAFYRPNFSGGRWQHHSRHDTLANVSAEEVVRLVEALLPLVTMLASRATWPFPRAIPAAQARVARELARDLFDF